MAEPVQITPWMVCGMCGDFQCTLHKQHVADCSCPTLEVWEESGWCPYDSPTTPALRRWVEANPYKENL